MSVSNAVFFVHVIVLFLIFRFCYRALH